MDKALAVAALRNTIAGELATLEAVAAMARDEIGSDETKQEGKYDTRSTEASYLARGQAWRIDELRRLLAWFEVFEPRPLQQVQVGALVALDGPRGDLVFVAPIGGAHAVVDGRAVRAISPSSPLGAAMADLEAGDAFEVATPVGLVSWEVTSVD